MFIYPWMVGFVWQISRVYIAVYKYTVPVPLILRFFSVKRISQISAVYTKPCRCFKNWRAAQKSTLHVDFSGRLKMGPNFGAEISTSILFLCFVSLPARVVSLTVLIGNREPSNFPSGEDCILGGVSHPEASRVWWLSILCFFFFCVFVPRDLPRWSYISFCLSGFAF